MPIADVADLFVTEASSISEVIACIDRSGRVSLALVVDAERRLVNTVSDGDVRRGLLAGLSMGETVRELLAIKLRTPYPVPVTARVGTPSAELLRTMKSKFVRQIPLVDPSGRVRDIAILADLLPQAGRNLRAVIMAGGFGTRLRPLTDNMPKPMLPVSGRPVLEHILKQLTGTGVRHVHITTHYQAEKIRDHFKDGAEFGADIQYVHEAVPLGTGGALGLLQRSDEPLLVINGDILTQVDFRAMHAFHEENRADMTIGVRRYEVKVPYGVIDCDGASVSGLREKPDIAFFVNAGIYLLEPDVLEYIPADQHMNMTDLVLKLIESRKSVVSYPICEYWLDVGQLDQYEQAQEDARTGKLVLLDSGIDS